MAKSVSVVQPRKARKSSPKSKALASNQTGAAGSLVTTRLLSLREAAALVADETPLDLLPSNAKGTCKLDRLMLKKYEEATGYSTIDLKGVVVFLRAVLIRQKVRSCLRTVRDSLNLCQT